MAAPRAARRVRATKPLAKTMHRDEGIRDLDNCVRCHRSADDEGGEGED